MSGLAKNSRTVTRYVREALYGVIPAAALTALRTKNANFDYAISGEVDEEVINRNKTGYAQLSAASSGTVPFQLSYGSFDDLIEGAMFSNWSDPVAVSETDISAAASDNSFNTVLGDFLVSGVVVGAWLKVAGMAAANNGGMAQVVSVTALKVIVSGLALTDESATAVTMDSSGMIRNGSVSHSHLIEREYPNITKFMQYLGQVVNSMSLNINAAAKISGSFEMVGGAATHGAATVGTGAHVAAPTTDTMNSTNNISNVREGGSLLDTGVYITALGINLSNDVAPDNIIGQLAPACQTEGDCSVNGTATFFFANTDLYDKYINGTESSISIKVADAAGNAYIITLPAVKYTAAPLSGDKSISIAMTYEAFMDDTTQCSMQIDRFAA